MQKTKPIIIVVGGQFGSESKGLVCGELAKEKDVDICVRTGSINAGHTVIYKGQKFVNQQIPVGWVNERAKLVIGAGTYVSPSILKQEIEMINKATGEDVTERLYIDERCGIHLDRHHEEEKGMHERMGSTGEGVMAAIVDKMKRDFDYKLFGDTNFAKGLRIVDTVELLNNAYDNNEQIMLEGTQGALLDFHLGYYPYVTSRQTNAGAWMMEAGLSPNLKYEIVLVCRTMPIRVAGNSGYMGDMEYSWQEVANSINSRLITFNRDPLISINTINKFSDIESEVARELGLPNTLFHTWDAETRKKYSEQLVNVHKIVLTRMEEDEIQELRRLFEITTVTKKLRRIAKLDTQQLQYSISINRPDYIVLNFMNYIFPTTAGCTTLDELKQSPEFDLLMTYINKLELIIGVPIKYINSSPLNIICLK